MFWSSRAARTVFGGNRYGMNAAPNAKVAREHDARHALAGAPRVRHRPDRDVIDDRRGHRPRRTRTRTRAATACAPGLRAAWCVTKCGVHFGIDGMNEPMKVPHVRPDELGADVAHEGAAAVVAERTVVFQDLGVERDGACDEKRLDGEVQPIGVARRLAELALARVPRVEVGRRDATRARLGIVALAPDLVFRRGLDDGGRRRQRLSVQRSRRLLHGVCSAPWRRAISFEPDAKKKTAQVIKAIEAKTSAEVVVALRHRVARVSRDRFDLRLRVRVQRARRLWFSPKTYPVEGMPFEMLGAFVVGAVLSAFVRPLRRALTPKATVTRQLDTGARAAFYDLGIAKTHRRSGLLVFVVALRERVRARAGRRRRQEGPPRARRRPRRPRSRGPSPRAISTAFLKALETHRPPPLEKAMPRKAGDENELPDEPT